MEKAKKRVGICLVCVVMLAVIMGIFYYYHNMDEEGLQAEGTLVSAEWTRRKHTA